MNPPPGPRPLLGLMSTWVYALLPANLVPAIIGRLVGELGVSLEVAGATATAMTIANGAAVLGARRLVERGHRPATARVGVAVLVGASVVGALFPEPAVVMAAIVVGGLGSGLVIAAATAAVAASEDPDRATTLVIIVNRVVVAAAFLLLPLAGGGMRELLLLLAAPGVIAFLGAAWLQPPPAAPAADPASGAPRSPRPNRVAWALALAFALWTVTDEGVYGMLEILIRTNAPETGDGLLSLMFAASVFAGLAGAVCVPLLHRFFSRPLLLAVFLGVSAVAKLVISAGSGAVPLAVGGIVWGFAFGALIPLVFGLAARLAADGSASVLANGTYVVGVALGPLVATQLAAVGGTGALAAVLTAVAVAAGSAVVVAAVRAEKAETRPAPPAPQHPEEIAP
ncbi:MFS transporter [Nocardiopsis sp. CC223A]|uniref:MFS transporter n=1 Tax=Nocardiopsis sp. CC223A TaxID=3044051 RepID=UPI00278C8B48|nr:MFS transporter [Nocardiopsis sp. CC223A]